MDAMQLQIGRTGPNQFTVIERDNCVLVEGSLSVAGIRGVTAMCHKKAVVSPQLAKMLGVNFAFGLAKDVDALIASITPELEAAAKRGAAARGLSEAAAVWLSKGERGNSSETIFTVLTGVDANTGSKNAHPYDPADVRRCLLLLEDVPELKERFDTMRTVSEPWSRLVDSWNEITATLLIEWGDIRNPKRGASAPRTYQLIEKAIGQ